MVYDAPTQDTGAVRDGTGLGRQGDPETTARLWRNLVRIPFNKTCFGPREEAAAVQALRGGRLEGDGEFTGKACEGLRGIVGTPLVLLTPSGTHAIELGLRALGIGPGDEVICPSFAFVSTANAVVQLGARPVFCEIEPDTLNLDPKDLDRCLSGRSRAVMPIHYGGVPCDVDAIRAALGDRPVSIIEDAAHALGSRYKGRPVGTLGKVSAFSFHDTKNVSCGEGGAMATTDQSLMAKAEIIREKGTDRAAYLRGETEAYTWISTGSSYLLADLLAAVLAVQLERWQEIQERRRRVWETYRGFLEPYRDSGRISLGRVPSWAAQNFHTFWFLARDPRDRGRILASLRARGVMASFHFIPLDSAPFAQERLGTGPALAVTADVSGRLVRLPLYPSLTQDEIQYVLNSLERTLRE